MVDVNIQVFSLGGEELACVEANLTITVSGILEKLLEAHEHRICALVYQDSELNGAWNIRDLGFSVGVNRVTAVFRTKEWLEDSGFTPFKLMGMDSDSMVRRTAHQLKSRGYIVKELKATGYAACELQTCLVLMKEAGYSVEKLKNVGFSVEQMCESGYSATQLKNAGFPFGMFLDANFSAPELIEAGFGALDFLENGCTLQQLQKLSFPAGQLLKELKDAGYTSELKDAGYTAQQLKVAGYSLVQLKKIFSLAELKEAGYNAWVLAKSGFGIKQLMTTGFSEKEMIDAGFILPSKAQPKHVAMPSMAA